MGKKFLSLKKAFLAIVKNMIVGKVKDKLVVRQIGQETLVPTEGKSAGVTGGAVGNDGAFKVGEVEIIGLKPGADALKTPGKIILSPSGGGNMTAQA